MPLRIAITAALIATLQCFTGLSTPVKAADDPASANAAAAEIPWPTQSWPVSTPEEQGMDPANLARLVENVGSYKQDSFMVIRHGRIVAEAYYAPYVAGIPHDLRSVTKSVIGTLVGIEAQRGELDDANRAVLDFFADKPRINDDDIKRAMTVQHLLDMTSGIKWRERAYTPDETIMQMYRSPDRVSFVLDQPMSNAPGTQFYYNSGNPYVLSALITRKTGQSAFDFAKKELFAPLGITNATWGRVDAQGVTDGESGLYLTPHDMARIGYLYLHDGMWDGKQLIPRSWVERAKAGPVKATFGFHYGNLWWSLPAKNAYMARGRHSQLILVLPKLDIVAVMTGVLRDDEYYAVPRLIDDISNAVKSETALPADPIAESLLTVAIRQAATERPSALGGTPELAKTVSGRTYRIDNNDLHVKTFALNFVGSDSSWTITTETGKPDHPEQQFTGPMGLDGTFRTSAPAFYGINAVRGRWLNEHTFALERRILGHGETQSWFLTFDGNKVSVAFENTDGAKAELHGEAME
ncbi:serine hydrolase [Bradyrhizobium genosp. L]|uniref:serine hydrolase domain-containing protein n=1 Tax=Bradyrhizobium genosp. L TaxID=83637 RepID=UPI0018A2F722|nr:serine hydrolase [Bradyrhizobium genosp. L]QPF84344.1 serine hydrolase [Bradyrhizobium genosp. L]